MNDIPMYLLPWALWIILDGGTLVETPMRYATYEECMKEGTLISMSMKVDMQITGHFLEPKCVKS